MTTLDSRRRTLVLGTLALLALLGDPALGLLAFPLLILGARPSGEGRPRMGVGGEAAAVAVVAGVVVVRAWTVAPLDEPLGQDWPAYLRNAVVLAEGPASMYRSWRAPLHGWSTLGAASFTGWLVEGAALLSLLAQATTLGLTWWIGRRLHGPLPAVLGVALLASWPSFGAFARACTPYPLLTCLLLSGAVLLVEATEPGRRRASAIALAAGAGLALGLAIGTDLRGLSLAGAVVTALAAGGALWGRGPRAVALPGLAFAVAAALGGAILATAPVDLVPLREQIALQLELHASEGPPACRAGRRLGCVAGTLAMNLGKAQVVAPLGLPFVAALMALGAAAAPRRPEARLVPAALLLLLLPSLGLLAFVDRYLLPAAPFLALLGGAGLAWIGRGGWRGGLVALGLVGLLAGGWGEARPEIPQAQQREDGLLTLARQLRGEVAPGDRVVDCGRAAMRVRLYPIPVEEVSMVRGGRLSAMCRRLVEEGPGEGRTWLVLRETPDATPSPAWERMRRVEAHGASPYLLLRGGG